MGSGNSLGSQLLSHSSIQANLHSNATPPIADRGAAPRRTRCRPVTRSVVAHRAVLQSGEAEVPSGVRPHTGPDAAAVAARSRASDADERGGERARMRRV